MDISRPIACSPEIVTSANDFDGMQKELTHVLGRLFDIMFPVAVLFGGIALAASLYRSLQYGWYGTMSLHAGMYLIALVLLISRRRLPVMLLFSVMIGLIFTEVIHSLYYRGLASAGMMNLAILAVFTGIFLGQRAGLGTVIIGTLIVSLLAAGYCTGRIAMSFDANEYLAAPIVWIINLSCFITYVVPLVLTVTGLHERITMSLKQLGETASSLAAEVSMRQQVEVELRRSEANYRSIFNNSIMGIFRSSPDGHYLEVNPAFARLIGFTTPEELMTTVADIGSELYVDPDERKRFLVILEDRGVVEGYEIQVRHRSGETIWVLATARKVCDADGKTLYYEGTVENISARKQAEKALRESEATLRQVIDLVPHFIFAKDREGRFILVNKAVADAYGTTVGEITGKRDADFNASLKEVEQFMGDDLRVMDSIQPLEIPEETITDARGKVRILQTTKIPFTLSAVGDAVLGVSTDITERKRAERAVRESGEKYRKIFENAVEGIFQATFEGHLLSANPALARMLGYSSGDELMVAANGLGEARYVNPKDRVHLLQQLKENAMIEGRELQIYRKDGTIIWASMSARAALDEGGQIVSIDGTLEDITQRKTSEQALLESEAKYRSVVESSLAGFFIIQDGRFRFVNARACEITGYSRAEVVDRLHVLDLIHPADRPKASENIEKRLRGEHGQTEQDYRVIKRDGSVITIKVLGGVSTYAGRPALCGTFLDITHEKMMAAQLRHAQKMEAIGTLAGGIAHDFNNILTALIGYGTILQTRMNQGDPLRLYTDLILSASHKAANLTQSLLAFSRKRPISLKPVDLNGIVKGTEKLLRRLITEDITLETHLTESELVVLADTTQIDQILFNLTTNARDAMPRGGIVRITSDMVRMDRDFILTHGFGEEGWYALLAVSDTGVGMGKETQEKIFEPFFTTKEFGRGTGLGLSTVYGIVKQHHGYITVASEHGRGTTFHIYLPVARTAPDDEPVVAGQFKGGHETILVAEDDEDVRRLVRDILRDYGYTVIEAVDGQDAVDKSRGHEGIALIILDCVMPRLNGRETYEAIRSVLPETRFLFMSGHTSDIVLDKGVGEPEFAFISKPLEPKSLLTTIREIIEREEATNPFRVPS